MDVEAMTAFETAVSWTQFRRAAPTFAAAGIRLLTQPDGVAIAFLATISERLHLAPVCPIFCDDDIYLSVGRATPKRRDLDADARWVLHAFLGANDEEFRIEGLAARANDEAERDRVHRAIRFGAFDR